MMNINGKIPAKSYKTAYNLSKLEYLDTPEP